MARAGRVGAGISVPLPPVTLVAGSGRPSLSPSGLFRQCLQGPPVMRLPGGAVAIGWELWGGQLGGPCAAQEHLRIFPFAFVVPPGNGTSSSKLTAGTLCHTAPSSGLCDIFRRFRGPADNHGERARSVRVLGTLGRQRRWPPLIPLTATSSEPRDVPVGLVEPAPGSCARCLLSLATVCPTAGWRHRAELCSRVPMTKNHARFPCSSEEGRAA